MKFITPRHKIVGMYLSDFGDVYNNTSKRSFITDEFSNYIPIFNLFNLNNQEEIRFADGANKNNEIVTYNKNTSSQRLSSGVIRSKKIDVTANDLILGPVNLFLNFTRYNITTVVGGEYQKTFLPIENDKLDCFKGKVIVLTINTFNNPKLIQDITGYTNYLETLIEKYKHKSNPDLEEYKDVITYIHEKWRDTKVMDAMSISNSIKVVTLIEIDESSLILENDKTIFVPNRNLVVSLENIVEVKEHPNTSSNILGNKDNLNILKSNSITCYIVDNEDLISDRFINVAGVVKKINKIKNHNLVNGLYLIQIDAQNKTNSEIICKLEDLDDNQYVFKSVEEANVGADKRNQYKDSIESMRNELEVLRLDKANESIRLKAHYDELMRKQNMDHEVAINALKLKIDEHKLHAEKQSTETKSQYEDKKYKLETKGNRRKAKYEKERYERDTVIETLKTIGAIAGLAAGGFVLYSKLNRN